MIVWSGRGIFSALVLIAVLFLFIKILPDEYQDYGFVMAFFIAGLFSWFFGNKWNNGEGRSFIDEVTGQRVIIKGNHSLFWIKMQYWGGIFSIIGIIILFQSSIIAAIIVAIIFVLIFVFLYMNGKKNRNIAATQNDPEPVRDIKIQKEEPVETESEEERLMHKQKKEDPSRFMPH